MIRIDKIEPIVLDFLFERGEYTRSVMPELDSFDERFEALWDVWPLKKSPAIVSFGKYADTEYATHLSTLVLRPNANLSQLIPYSKQDDSVLTGTWVFPSGIIASIIAGFLVNSISNEDPSLSGHPYFPFLLTKDISHHSDIIGKLMHARDILKSAAKKSKTMKDVLDEIGEAITGIERITQIFDLINESYLGYDEISSPNALRRMNILFTDCHEIKIPQSVRIPKLGLDKVSAINASITMLNMNFGEDENNANGNLSGTRPLSDDELEDLFNRISYGFGQRFWLMIRYHINDPQQSNTEPEDKTVYSRHDFSINISSTTPENMEILRDNLAKYLVQLIEFIYTSRQLVIKIKNKLGPTIGAVPAIT